MGRNRRHALLVGALARTLQGFHLSLECEQVFGRALGAQRAAGAGAPAAGVSRRRLPVQSGQLNFEIGRQGRGAFEPRIAHRDVRELAGQIDQQRQRQQMWSTQSGPNGHSVGEGSNGDTTDCNDTCFISERRVDGASVENRWSPRSKLGVACTDMQQQGDDAARLSVLDELRRSALDTYGEERCADLSLEAALRLAATAVWRVSQEPLEPFGNEPLPTDG
jgi:hypothetical protein